MIDRVDPDIPGSFLGRGMAWPPRENARGDFAQVEDEESIADCLRNLIHTEYGTVPGMEAMGTEVEQLLFENDVQGQADIVGESIARAIREYEKRVFFMSANFVAQAVPGNQHRIAVKGKVRYRIRATGQIQNNVFPFIMRVQQE